MKGWAPWQWRRKAPKRSIHDLQAAIYRAEALTPTGSLWRHRKSGNLYRVAMVGLLESTTNPVVIYRPVEHGMIWVRPLSEFLDGRFERVSAPKD